jgi:hypothetical protein
LFFLSTDCGGENGRGKEEKPNTLNRSNRQQGEERAKRKRERKRESGFVEEEE